MTEERLFVGTSDGCVLLYRVESTQTNSSDMPLLESYLELKKNLGHGKRAVEQIQIVSELNQILVLCDQLLVALDPQSLEPSGAISIKGVTRFCTERKGPLYRLCVAMKKRLQLHEYVGNYVLYKELSVPDTVLALEWHSDTIIVGYRREYSLINVNTGKPRELFPIERAHRVPLVKLLSDEEILVSLTMGTENLGMFVDFDGNAMRQNVVWSQQPLHVTHTAPYLLTLLPKSLEVHDIHDQELLQTVPFSGGTVMCSDSNGHIYVATPNRVSLVVPQPIDKQVSDLLGSRRINEALDLVTRATGIEEDRDERLKVLHGKAGYAMMRDLDFDEAAVHFGESNVDPLDVLSMFPHAIPPSYSHNTTQAVLRDDDVMSAVQSLMPWLRTQRWAPDQSAPVVANIIDTAILRILADKNVSEAIAMLKAPNRVILEGTDEYLTRLKKHSILALLYTSKHHLMDALKIYQQLGNGAIDGDSDGVDESIDVLCHTDDESLIWEYAPWLLRRSPDKAISIFTSHLGIDHDKVLDFIGQYGDTLAQQYLEYLVIVQKLPDPSLHTQLALKYLDTVSMLIPTSPAGTQPGHESGLLGQVRKSLLDFLSSSEYINVPAVLGHVRDTSLHHECALLYARLGHYELGLRRLVYDLKDFDQAEQYCHTHLHDRNDVFLTLLDVVLHPPGGTLSDQMMTYAMSMLDRHWESLDPVAVINLLPSSLPISVISPFLSRSMPLSLHKYRDGQVMCATARQDNLQTRITLSQVLKAGVVVSRELYCPICDKRIGDKVFARFPDGNIVHFNCLRTNEQGEKVI